MRKEALKFLLAIKIKELRLQKGISMKELAKKSQLSVSYLNEIEKAKKYPLSDKLMSLALALEVDYNELVSINVPTKLQPLVDFYQNSLFHKLPMQEFGISETDLFDLVSYDPGKFGSLLTTLQELRRTYDIDLSSINRAALRAFQETNNNYFEDIENLVDDFLKEQEWLPTKHISIDNIKKILIQKYNYTIDENILSETENLKHTRSVFKKGNPNKLLVNKKLGERQKLFVYARELGSCLFGGKRQNITGPGVDEENYKDVFHDFRASYFAGALMIHRRLIVEDITTFFTKEQFSSDFLSEIMDQYGAGSEVFFHRLSQVLPKFFGLNHLFFLRSNHNIVYDQFNISKEMHLARLHEPHGSRLGEKYCRRWITIYLLQDFLKIKNKTSTSRLIDAQISSMLDSKEKYLCLSIARESKLKDSTNTCITIGIHLDQKAKSIINFLKDENITRKIVGQTCERCVLSDCKERVAEPLVYLATQKKIERKKELIKVFDLL